MSHPLSALLALLLLSLAAACGGDIGTTPAGDDPLTGEPGAPGSPGVPPQAPPVPRTVPLNLLFVHGVALDPASHPRAGDSLRAVEAAVLGGMAERIADYEAAHPGVVLKVQSARVNLYTDANGAPLSPSIDTPADGTGVPTATLWRQQLVKKLQLAYPNGEKNILLVGHSTGGRVIMEVAANVGGAGRPGSFDWGLGDRVVGAISMNGMIGGLQSSEYNFVATLDFITGCKLASAPGWCEYAGNISAMSAADWVAANKRALMLVSAGSCSPSIWTGENDKALPLAAEASPNAFGLRLTPARGQTLGPAHGLFYGQFCHSDMTDGGSPRHSASVERISQEILKWLFESAPKVVNVGLGAQQQSLPSLAPNTWSSEFAVTGGCPDAEKALPDASLAGVCVHDGFFDGDDHAFGPPVVLTEVEQRPDCGAAFRWKQAHGEPHAARSWLKSYARPADGGFVSTLKNY